MLPQILRKKCQILKCQSRIIIQDMTKQSYHINALKCISRTGILSIILQFFKYYFTIILNFNKVLYLQLTITFYPVLHFLKFYQIIFQLKNIPYLTIVALTKKYISEYKDSYLSFKRSSQMISYKKSFNLTKFNLFYHCFLTFFKYTFSVFFSVSRLSHRSQITYLASDEDD